MQASFIAAKSFISARQTLYLTTCSREDPESSRTSFRFCRTVLCVIATESQPMPQYPITASAIELTVACLISPVAVWPAQKTSPGTLTAGPEQLDQQLSFFVHSSRECKVFCMQILTVVRLGRELLARDELTRHLVGSLKNYWSVLIVQFQECVKKFELQKYQTRACLNCSSYPTRLSIRGMLLIKKRGNFHYHDGGAVIFC